MRFPPRAHRRAALSALAALLLVAAPARAQTPATGSAPLDRPVTAIIVRHAERASAMENDPPLDSAGSARAAALREVLRDAGVSAIYVTQYRRTRDTAEPLATALGLEPRVIAASNPVEAHARAIADTLLARHRGEVVLVVGHSNTIGPIARALGANAPAALEDHEYENLYIVTADGTAQARFVRAKFGAPNPRPR